MNTHYFLKPPLDKWPDELGKNVGTLLWSFCNYQQKAVTFLLCWWDPLLSHTGQKPAGLLLCSIRSWHRLMSNISSRWMMRLGGNAAAIWIFCIGFQSFLGSVCHVHRDRHPAQPAKECVLPHSISLGYPVLQTFLCPTAATKWTQRLPSHLWHCSDSHPGTFPT